jgi:hypothetical protein
MATRFGPFVYQLGPTEGLTVTINTTANGFAVIAGLDSIALNFSNGVPLRIPPEMMNGLGSIHHINLRCFFTVGAGNNANYTISAADDNGNLLDTTTIPIVTAQQLPYQVLQQIVVGV